MVAGSRIGMGAGRRVAWWVGDDWGVVGGAAGGWVEWWRVSRARGGTRIMGSQQWERWGSRPRARRAQQLATRVPLGNGDGVGDGE